MIDWKGELFEWMPGCIGIFRHDGECLRTVALNAKMRDILGVTEEDVQTSTCKSCCRYIRMIERTFTAVLTRQLLIKGIH